MMMTRESEHTIDCDIGGIYVRSNGHFEVCFDPDVSGTRFKIFLSEMPDDAIANPPSNIRDMGAYFLAYLYKVALAQRGIESDRVKLENQILTDSEKKVADNKTEL